MAVRNIGEDEHAEDGDEAEEGDEREEEEKIEAKVGQGSVLLPVEEVRD